MENVSAERVATQIRVTAALQRKSLAQIAREIRMSTSSFSRRMAGDPAFNLDELDRVATALHTTTRNLMDDAERAELADQVAS